MAIKQNKLGPCGTPGNPPCDVEYIKLVNESDIPESYKKDLIADAEKYLGPANRYGGRYNKVDSKNVENDARKLTKKRLEQLKETNAYKKLIANPNAGEIFRAMRSSLEKIENDPTLSKRSFDINDYALPSLSEIPELIKLGDKYADFDNNTKISFVDKARGGYLGVELLNRYPNLQAYIPKKRNKKGKMVSMSIPFLKEDPKYFKK
mgnify:CR=1 FL=1